MPSCEGRTPPTRRIAGVDLDRLAEVVLVRFPRCRVAPVSPLCVVSSSEGSQGRGVGRLCVGQSVQGIRAFPPFVPVDQYVLTDAHFILRV